MHYTLVITQSANWAALAQQFKNTGSNKMSREREIASQLVHKIVFVPGCHV